MVLGYSASHKGERLHHVQYRRKIEKTKEGMCYVRLPLEEVIAKFMNHPCVLNFICASMALLTSANIHFSYYCNWL